MSTDIPTNRPLVPIALVAPAAIVLLLLLVIPILGVVRDSFTIGPTDTRVTLANYQAFFSDSFNVRILINTLATGFEATLLSLVFSYPLAIYLTFGNDRLRRYLILATIAPLLVSVVVRCYALVILFGPANPINQIAPYGFHMDLLFTAPGVMVGFIYTLAPFMVLSIVASLSNIDQRTIYAARSLGAGTWTVFRRLIVPLSLPGVLSGSLIVFTLVITSLPIPLLLGGARYKMVISLVYQQILLLFNWPYGYAMSLILVALSLLVLTVAVRLIGRVPGMTR